MGDGCLMVQIFMCFSMYDGSLIGKPWRWYIVEDVGTWNRWKNGFGRLVGYIECLCF